MVSKPGDLRGVWPGISAISIGQTFHTRHSRITGSDNAALHKELTEKPGV